MYFAAVHGMYLYLIHESITFLGGIGLGIMSGVRDLRDIRGLRGNAGVSRRG